MKREQFSPPLLLIITGVPGSGKTTLMLGNKNNGLLSHINAFYINKDSINDGFTTKRTGTTYDGVVRDGTYEAIKNILGINLLHGSSIVVEGPYSREVNKGTDWLQAYEKITHMTGGRLKYIRCTASEWLIKERLKERNLERDKEKLENWNSFLEAEPIHVEIPPYGIALDTTKNTTDVKRTALEYLCK